MSSIPSHSDILSAFVYGNNRYVDEQIKKHQKKIDMILFQNVTRTESEWTDQDLNTRGLDTSKIKKKIIYEYTSCDHIRCFPFHFQTGAKCDKFDGKNNCQSVCYRYKKQPLFDLKNVDGKCYVVNTALKRWCLGPGSRSNDEVVGLTDVPGFDFVDDEHCRVNKKYCDRMGLGFEKGDCKLPPVQGFFEKWLLGKTLTRAFMVISNSKATGVDSDRLASLSMMTQVVLRNLFEGKKGPEFDLVFGDATTTQSMPNFNTRTVLDMMKDMSEYLGVDVSVKALKTLAMKLISQLGSDTITGLVFRNLGKNMLQTLIRVVLCDAFATTVFKSVTVALARALVSFVAQVVDPLTWITIIVTVVGMVIDLAWDPLGFKNEIGKKEVDRFQSSFEAVYQETLGVARRGELIRLTPDIILSYYENPESKDDAINLNRGVKIMGYAKEYLDALKVNSFGQIIHWGDEISFRGLSDRELHVLSGGSEIVATTSTKLTLRDAIVLCSGALTCVAGIAARSWIWVACFFTLFCCVVLYQLSSTGKKSVELLANKKRIKI